MPQLQNASCGLFCGQRGTRSISAGWTRSTWLLGRFFGSTPSAQPCACCYFFGLRGGRESNLKHKPTHISRLIMVVFSAPFWPITWSPALAVRLLPSSRSCGCQVKTVRPS